MSVYKRSPELPNQLKKLWQNVGDIYAPTKITFHVSTTATKLGEGAKSILKLQFLFIVGDRNLKFGVVVTFKKITIGFKNWNNKTVNWTENFN